MAPINTREPECNRSTVGYRVDGKEGTIGAYDAGIASTKQHTRTEKKDFNGEYQEVYINTDAIMCQAAL